MSNELMVLSEMFTGGNNLPSLQSAEDLRQLDGLSQITTFIPRIQLFTKGKAVDKSLIAIGHYGIPKGGDQIVDLGKSIDVLPFWRKAKAMDMSDTDNLIVVHDAQSDEFKRIVKAADSQQDSGCAYGPTYLVWERSTGAFYEFFCGTKSARYEAPNINKYLPVTQAMIDAGLTDESEPRGARPLTLGAQYLEKGRFSWYAPKAEDCLTPFDKLPTKEQFAAETERFFKPDETGAKVVTEKQSSRKR